MITELEGLDLGFNPDWVSKPGSTISDLLEEKQITIGQFSAMMQMSVLSIFKLIDAKLLIDKDVAYRLSVVLGSTPQFWLNRERNYRAGLALAKKDNY